MKDIANKGRIGEEFVNELAYNSFLKYWCYPGPRFENGDKKEICDLLILFGETVIIVSVKNYEFKGNHTRYFNNTLKKALKQIHGAYNTLFTSGEVIIKHPERASEVFPAGQFKKIFRVIVNLGEGTKFNPFYGLTKNNDYVAMFDRPSFETIIGELDTIADFTEYLEKREALSKNKNIIVITAQGSQFTDETKDQFSKTETNPALPHLLLSGTEKDLLSIYFENGHNFPSSLHKDEQNMSLLMNGAWARLAAIPRAKNRKNEDQLSYFIDNLVRDQILKKYEFETLTPDALELTKSLLSFNRVQRRIISKEYFNFYDKFEKYHGNKLPRRYFVEKGIGILFTFSSDQMDLETRYLKNKLSIISLFIESTDEVKSAILFAADRSGDIKLQQINRSEIFPSEETENALKQLHQQRQNAAQTIITKREEEFPE